VRATEGDEAFEVAQSGMCIDLLVSKEREIEFYLSCRWKGAGLSPAPSALIT